MGFAVSTRNGSVLAAALGVAVLLLAACGGDDDAEPRSPTAQTDGVALYAAHCASCHGKDLRGTSQGPSHLSEVYEPNHHPDESFRRAIQNGVGAHHWRFGDMAPVAGLSSAEVDAIIGYVRQVQAREGFEPYPPQ
jgi:mono/diheme cytochrome c family protein